MKAKRVRAGKLATGFLLISVILAVSVIAYNTYALLKKPMMTEGLPVIIEVKPDSPASDLIQILYVRQLITSKSLFLKLIKFEGIANKLKAGIYQIEPGESAQHLLHRIVAGDVLVLPFRISDGSTVSQISALLQKAPYLKYDGKDWLSISEDKPNAEGLLLADTYNYPAGTHARSLLHTANKKLLLYLQNAWQNRAPGMPYKTSYEMLIAASILEKETGVAGERRLIAGIIVNRLLKRMPLQMDPAVIYALGDNYSGKLSHNDLSVDSPYNTYRNQGLPPTPIAMVGKDAIDAAAHPQVSKYLYFVARGDGTHEFSETYDQHKKAVSRYLK